MVLTSQPIRERVMQSAVIREENGLSTLAFYAMGTRCRVSLVEPTRATANEYLQTLLHWVADFEAKYSRFLADSLISRINSAAGSEWVEIDAETERIFAMCDELQFFTQGVFDPTALPLIRLWNWKENPPVLPCDSAIAQARELVGWRKVQRKNGAVFLPRAGMCIDLGGIGKEYAVDMAIQFASEAGISNVLVDFGQDIRASGRAPGKPAWHIGLENPRSAGTCWASVAASGVAIATSGDYLRHFTVDGRRYGHIIDPRSGMPVANGCLSVAVVAPSCTMAGILSTTAFVLGAKDGFDLVQRSFGAAAAFVTENGALLTPRMYEYIVNLQNT